MNINHNKVMSQVIQYVHLLPTTYDKIVFEYEKVKHIGLGLSDCAIYSLAIIELCKKKRIKIEDYLKEIENKTHTHTFLFLIYSFIDLSITLKLNNIKELSSMGDAAYEKARMAEATPGLEFMRVYMHGWLLMHSVDDDKVKADMREEWFSVCLLALSSFKEARRIATLEKVDMPIREALLDLQIHTIHMAMVDPHVKKGFNLGAINVLAYNHDIEPSTLRNVSEVSTTYLSDIYTNKKAKSIIKSPYNFDLDLTLSL